MKIYSENSLKKTGHRKYSSQTIVVTVTSISHLLRVNLDLRKLQVYNDFFCLWSSNTD